MTYSCQKLGAVCDRLLLGYQFSRECNDQSVIIFAFFGSNLPSLERGIQKASEEIWQLITWPTVVLPAQYWNNWSYQLKLSDVSLPPQVRPHLGTNRWQTIISVHNHVNKTITCCTKVGWKEKKNYQDWRNPAACKTSQVTQVCITQHKAAQHWEWERILTDTTCKKKKKTKCQWN